MNLIKSLREISVNWIEDVIKADRGSIESWKIVKEWETPVSQVALLSIDHRHHERGSPSSLFLKVTKPGLQNELIGIGKREVDFYDTVLPMLAQKCSPHCYYAAFDDRENLFNIALEDLSGTHFQSEWPLPPSIRYCGMAIECLAQMHAFWWDHSELEGITESFASEAQVSEWIEQMRRDGAEFISFMGDRLSAKGQSIMEKWLASLDKQSKRYLTRKNLTMTHNDAHLGNFMFPKDRNGSAKIIDWQGFGHGVATDDLAYMMALSWFPDRRRQCELELLEAYNEELLRQGVGRYSLDDLLLDYRRSVLGHIATPIWQWKHGIWAGIWHNNLERILMAYDDLHCSELLE